MERRDEVMGVGDRLQPGTLARPPRGVEKRWCESDGIQLC